MSGRSSGASSVGEVHHRLRGEHRPAGLEDRHRVRRQGYVDVDDLVTQRLEQPAGVLPGGDALGVDVGLRDHRLDEPGDPQPAGLAVAGGDGTTRRRSGAQNGSPTARPAITSRNAAASRTVRASEPLVARPTGSPYIGAPEIRPRVGLSPTMPQQLAGIRIEPPPSEPCASGDQTGRHRGARSPARAARHPGGVPRRHRGRRALGLGVAGRAELRRTRLAEADHPRRSDPADHLVVEVGHEVGEHRRAEAGPDPGGRVQVLDRGRYAGQRTLADRAALHGPAQR